MRALLASLVLLVAPACVGSGATPSLYIQGDLATYQAITPALDSFIDNASGQPLEQRPLDPVTGDPMTDDDLASLSLLVQTWTFRLQGAGVLELDGEVSDE